MACDKGGGPSPGASTSASPSASATPDDDKTPAELCMRLTSLRKAMAGASGMLDPRVCIEQLKSARFVRPDLYRCLSLCIVRAQEYPTAARCSTMCAPAEGTCASPELSQGQADVCLARFRKLQADESTSAFACVARCSSKPGIAAAVECMGTECGL